MSYVAQSQANISAATAASLVERAILSTVTTLSCCIFLFINVTMLFSLRSKPVFCETTRYTLLFNLLFADSLQMILSQILCLLSSWRIIITYPLCGFLVMFANLTNEISPLIVVVMSLERYIAVCHPLQHATIITVRNTEVALLTVWALSSLNLLIRAILLLEFPFQDLESLQMKELCSTLFMLLLPIAYHYDRAYTCLVFVSASVTVVCTYIGVMVAARSASMDRASVCKARNTLLLHMLQLGLSLSSTVFNPLIFAISKMFTRLVFIRIQNFLYVCIILSPRCLSSLIYGVRDQTIRPVLLYYLCCRLNRSVLPKKQNVSA